MPESRLSPLVGRQITSANTLHDYVQLKFDNGDILNIFNAYAIESDTPIGIEALTGKCVVSASTLDREVRLELDGAVLSISLSDSAYRGPEAMEYIPLSGERTVWS